MFIHIVSWNLFSGLLLNILFTSVTRYQGQGKEQYRGAHG